MKLVIFEHKDHYKRTIQDLIIIIGNTVSVLLYFHGFLFNVYEMKSNKNGSIKYQHNFNNNNGFQVLEQF